MAKKIKSEMGNNFRPSFWWTLGKEQEENLTLEELAAVTEYKEDIIEILRCELMRENNSFASLELALSKMLMEEWERSVMIPTLINEVPYKTCPNGYTVIKDFLTNKSPKEYEYNVAN